MINAFLAIQKSNGQYFVRNQPMASNFNEILVKPTDFDVGNGKYMNIEELQNLN